MNDFFTRLAERALGLAPTLQPILAPMFVPEEALQMSDEPFETVVAPIEVGASDDAGTRSSRPSLTIMSDGSFETVVAPLEENAGDDVEMRSSKLPLTIPKSSSSSSSIETDDIEAQISGSLQLPSKREKSGEQTRFLGENASEKVISTSPTISASMKTEASPRRLVSEETRSPSPQARSLMPDPAPQLTAESRFIMPEAAVRSKSITSAPTPQSAMESGFSTPKAVVEFKSITPAPKPQLAMDSRLSTSEAPEHVRPVMPIHETTTPTQSRHRQEAIQSPQHATNGVRMANIPLVTTKATVLHTVEQKNDVKQAEQTIPTVHVTIGRIEVRATPPAIPTVPTQRQSSGPAVKSLDDYLRQRAKGGH